MVDLLKLKVPKLFAVEQGEEDEEVRRKFSTFLQNYIRICDLKHTILEKMGDILVREPNSHVLCIQLSEWHYKTNNKTLSPLRLYPSILSQRGGMSSNRLF